MAETELLLRDFFAERFVSATDNCIQGYTCLDHTDKSQASVVYYAEVGNCGRPHRPIGNRPWEK